MATTGASSGGPRGPTTPAAVELPKGGGAVRSMGETFSAHPSRGTASLTVPLPTSAAREGFGPQLALTYDVGSGNGLFGMGWSLGLPAITRRTDRGIPRYDDNDTFVLSGADDLV